MRPLFHLLRAALAGALFLTAALAADDAKTIYDIPAGDAAAALKQFSATSGRETLFAADAVRGVKTAAVKGELTAQEALDLMLADTALTATQDAKTGAFAVRRNALPNGPRAVERASDRPESKSVVKDGVVQLDTFEVMGGKVLNMDVVRSRDDAQPYVIFDRTAIELSGATSVEDFIRRRLPQDATQATESQVNSTVGPRSQINLRGLGQNQTLILIDGRRAGGASFGGTPLQPDLNGIPLAAIERIEILPTTASGIYGGGATGGVVNVILRRDYVGAEVRATYDNTFDADTALRRIDLSTGITLEGGKTNILFSASWSDQNLMLTQDRNFIPEGMKKVLLNNPNYFVGASTPLGAMTNIRASNGSNLVLKPQYGGAVLSSSFTSVPVGYTGAASDSGAALIANAGKYNLDQPDTLQNRGLRSSMLAAPERQSLMGTVRRQFTPWLQAFAEYQYSRTFSYFPVSSAPGLYNIPATAPTNPFTTTVQVAVPLTGGDVGMRTESRQARYATGLILSLPHDWKGTIDYSRDESTFGSSIPTNTSANADALAMISGALDPFRDVMIFPIDLGAYYGQIISEAKQRSGTYTAAARASGPVWSLPAGRPTVSTMFEHRGDIFRRSIFNNGIIIPRRTQFVNSGYMEAKIPLIGSNMDVPFVRELELQLAGRADSYEINATNIAGTEADVRKIKRELSTVDPTIGLRWLVMSSVMMRASYGTGYLPPAVNQLTPNPFVSAPLTGPTDPKRGNEAVTYRSVSGGNPGLRPELAEIYSAGVVLTSESLAEKFREFRFSVDWSRVEKSDNIASFPGAQTALIYEDLLPAGTIVRAPVEPGSSYQVGRVETINSSPVNFTRAEVESFDLQLDYNRDTAQFGRFELSLLATRTMHYKTQLTPIAAPVEWVGSGSLGSATNFSTTPIFPMKWKGNLNFTWRRDSWTAGWRTRYTDSYRLSPSNTSATTILAQGNGGVIEAQIIHDIFGGYRFGSVVGGSTTGWRAFFAPLLKGTEIQVGVRNVFNSSPAYDASAIGRLYSNQADSRVSSYYVNLKKSF